MSDVPDPARYSGAGTKRVEAEPDAMLPSVVLHCPYCGEVIELMVEDSSERHDYIEDCHVCCRPIAVTSWMDDGVAQVRVRSENE